LETARIDRRPLRASQIGFGLGPRINAAGRLDRADTAVELFLTDDARQARRLAGVLERQNLRRREIESQIREEALCPGGGRQACFPTASSCWPLPANGVIGIVAAKIAERFARPALLVSSGCETGKGSARSVADVDLYARLRACRGLFTSLGGHSHAAGFSIRTADIARLRRELNCDDRGSVRPAPAARRIDIDALLHFRDLGPGVAAELRRLAPFGHLNEPTFAAGRSAGALPRTASGSHLRLTLVSPRRNHATRTPLLHQFSLGAVAAGGRHVRRVAYDLDLEGGGQGPGALRLRDIGTPARGPEPMSVPAASGSSEAVTGSRRRGRRATGAVLRAVENSVDARATDQSNCPGPAPE
jgi:single-stranded DNA-specific DHH superfamily exonuclease